MKKTVRVIQDIEVEIDENKFDHNFRSQYLAHHDKSLHSVDDHILNLGESIALGEIKEDSPFLAGYGMLSKRGIKLKKAKIQTFFKLF